MSQAKRIMANTVISKIEQSSQDIINTIPDGVMIVDLETGSVLAANPVAGALHGYRLEELIGLDPSAFIIPTANGIRKLRSGISNLPGVSTPACCVRRDGIPFHAEWRDEIYLSGAAMRAGCDPGCQPADPVEASPPEDRRPHP
jgi:PAS domain S-box-containing protein